MTQPTALTKQTIVDVVATRIRDFMDGGTIHLPDNYSVENALKSAWLILQTTVDKEKRLALEICTQTSIANSLLDMVVQGLNPGKDQCYFIVYGKNLLCQRSYFGSMAVCKRVTDAKDIYAEVVYKDDEFEYEINTSGKHVSKHIQKLENVANDKVIAAYCVIVFENSQDYTDIMTIEQIKASWAKSRTKDLATHAEFTEEMARKTVINRACKAYINSSSDDHLLLTHYNRSSEEQLEEVVAGEISANANRTIIDIVDEPEAGAGAGAAGEAKQLTEPVDADGGGEQPPPDDPGF